jgi:hypothetical protein
LSQAFLSFNLPRESRHDGWKDKVTPSLDRQSGHCQLPRGSASSLVSVMLFGGVTSINYAAADLVAWGLAGRLLAGGTLGGLVDLAIAQSLSSRTLVALRGLPTSRALQPLCDGARRLSVG